MRDEFLDYERRLYERVRRERQRRHPHEKEISQGISRKQPNHYSYTHHFPEHAVLAPALGQSHPYY